MGRIELSICVVLIVVSAASSWIIVGPMFAHDVPESVAWVGYLNATVLHTLTLGTALQYRAGRVSNLRERRRVLLLFAAVMYVLAVCAAAQYRPGIAWFDYLLLGWFPIAATLHIAMRLHAGSPTQPSGVVAGQPHAHTSCHADRRTTAPDHRG